MAATSGAPYRSIFRDILCCSLFPGARTPHGGSPGPREQPVGARGYSAPPATPLPVGRTYFRPTAEE